MVPAAARGLENLKAKMQLLAIVEASSTITLNITKTRADFKWGLFFGDITMGKSGQADFIQAPITTT